MLVAVAADPSIEALTAVEPRLQDALGPAANAGVATLDRGSVRFTHPLLGQAVVAGADAAELQRAHTALARTASTDEVRARHLAGAAVGRDPNVAAALELAAATIRDRGATLDAAALYLRAAALTPTTDPEGAMRRARLAAETLFIDVSDYVEADRILEAAIAAGRARSGARRGPQPPGSHPLLPRPDARRRATRGTRPSPRSAPIPSFAPESWVGRRSS